jgi:hypothetical protein
MLPKFRSFVRPIIRSFVRSFIVPIHRSSFVHTNYSPLLFTVTIHHCYYSLTLFTIVTIYRYYSSIILSSFRPRGVPGPTSKLSPRVPAQMSRSETEHEGGQEGRTDKRGNPRPSCCPAPRSGALAVGGYKRPHGRERETFARRLVPPRGQPSRTRALDLPFIGVRRGPRCTIGDVAVC